MWRRLVCSVLWILTVSGAAFLAGASVERLREGLDAFAGLPPTVPLISLGMLWVVGAGHLLAGAAKRPGAEKTV